MLSDNGPLVPTDEWFAHQIAETQAHVSESDRSWTEKACAMAAARDGSLYVGLGIGKYPNRNVFDGYAAVSRGRETWIVRGSRRLSDNLGQLAVGPIHYDVLEPMRTVRFGCEASDTSPIAFEWTFHAEVPAVLENRDYTRARDRMRLDVNLLRYHQTGVATGWVQIGDDRFDIHSDTWFSTRDHSWGVRHDVGLPVSDVEPAGVIDGMQFQYSWSPMLLERSDGSIYAVHHQLRDICVPAFGYEERRFEGTVEHPDGRIEQIAKCVPELRYDTHNRRILGGTLHFLMADGSERPITVEALGDTGLHLGLGLYMGLDGRHHGQWRGALHVEAEHITDCTDPATARRIHQIRDALMRVDDPAGGGHGWCNMQTIILGEWPELGLPADSSFM